jgi:TPR repeat protein
MTVSIALLKFAAKATLNAVAGGVGGDFTVEVLPEIARSIWTWWAKDRTESQRKADVQALVQAPPSEVQRQVKEVVREVAGAVPLDQQLKLETYLNEMPAVARQSLMRRDDPRGSTIPSHMPLQKPDDLLPFLPRRLPRFKPGDRPLKYVDWELVKLLGVGGFGEVWKARNPHVPNLQVALKFCLDPAAREQLLKHEAGVLARIMGQGEHPPGIVRLRQTYLLADPPCLEYEFIEGGDLAGTIHNHQAKQGPLSPDIATKIVMQLARAIGRVHTLSPPIVHRDLKPANVLVRSKEGKSEFLITDFGIGGVVTSQALEQTRRGNTSQPMLTSIKGAHTPLYASPEQKRGAPPDPRDDVHALGIIWYQMLVGDFSVGAPVGSAWKKTLLQRDLAEPLLLLLESCFESEAEHRPANAFILSERISEITRRVKGSDGGEGGRGSGKMQSPQSPFEQDMSDAFEELRTKGGHLNYFERQGPIRIGVWQTAAQNEDAIAQWLLANCHAYGTGIEQDDDAAVSWWRRAANNGLAAALNDLGDCYLSGIGVEEDATEAFRRYTKAAEQGAIQARINLGVCYFLGDGVEKDEAEAARCYRQAAEAGWVIAQHNMGCWYLDGESVEQDYFQAIGWYRKAAEQGYCVSQFDLGWCYEYGKGVKKDRVEAAKWYRMAAEQGLDKAQFAIGYCYEHRGYGVELDIAQAEQWYRKAAEQGHKRAKNALRRLQKKEAEKGEHPDNESEAEIEEQGEAPIKHADSGPSRSISTQAKTGAPALEELDTDAIMNVFRQTARGKGLRKRDELLKEVSLALGYRRLGSKIEEALRGHLQVAIRRRIIESDGDLVRLVAATIEQYELEDLRNTLCSVMRPGRKYEREEVIPSFVRYLGFARVTDTMRQAMKSAMNSAIRQGSLAYEGDVIWRV